MKNERYALRELTPMDGTRPSALPPVYLITGDREHITLGRVTHSEPGRSVGLCMVTDVI